MANINSRRSSSLPFAGLFEGTAAGLCPLPPLSLIKKGQQAWQPLLALYNSVPCCTGNASTYIITSTTTQTFWELWQNLGTICLLQDWALWNQMFICQKDGLLSYTALSTELHNRLNSKHRLHWSWKMFYNIALQKIHTTSTSRVCHDCCLLKEIH